MSNASDFIIENGVLTKYVGPGGDVVIPEGVTEIGNYVFEECQTLKSVFIPEGVTRIGTKAFYCSSIKSVNIPTTVDSYGAQAFSGCHELTTVDLPEGKPVSGSNTESQVTGPSEGQ